MEHLYSLRDVSRVFGEREVLRIDSLDLEKGRIYGLLGPNGSGKTTLMRILGFLDQPTSGELYFSGTKVERDLASRYRARVVWVPQVPVMFTGSLRYNIEYPMRLKGTPRRERRERALALPRDVGLAELAEAPARRLSGGEAQRGSVARALAAGAEVILFDEPTASVDSRSRRELMDLIARIHRERGLSIVIATHDLSLAEELCGESVRL